MGTNPSTFPFDSLPVEGVSWIDAWNFCARTRLRLPTEAEWEYACRAGTTGPRYGPVDVIAWHRLLDAENRTYPVATKAPNAWGLFDTLGNVWEWCFDWYTDGPVGRGSRDPVGPPAGQAKVLRGGSFEYGPPWCRASQRAPADPAAFTREFGFRVCRNP
jgi:formylglycine-generating enzyme required for sulfatase activity